MKNGFLLAMVGSLLALIGPVVLPFVTIIEEETSLAGYQLDTGLASLGLALMGVGLAAWFGRRRVQRAGWPLAGFAGLQLALMAWTYSNVWSLVPCAAHGMSACDPQTGGLIAQTLVMLDWGMVVATIGAIVAIVGGGLVLLAHPEYGKNARFLRVGLRWQGDTLSQQVYFRRKPVTVGEADYSGFQLPASGLRLHNLLTPITGAEDAWQLCVPRHMSANCQISGQPRQLQPGDVVRIGRGDAGIIDAGGDLTLSFDFMAAESAVIGGNDALDSAGMAVSFSLAAGMMVALLFSALMSERRGKRSLFEEQMAQRVSERIYLETAFEEPEEEQEQVVGEETETTAIQAPKEEGSVGKPDEKPEKKTELPPMDKKEAEDIKVEEIGVVQALKELQLSEGAVGDVTSGEGESVETRLAQASAGDGAEVQIGQGSGGMGFRGIGSGGGGTGKPGALKAIGELKTGTGPGRIADLGRPKKRIIKRKKPIPIPIPSTSGFCEKGQLARVIRRRAAAFRACYERQLMAHPGLSGKLAVSWTIDTNGRVQRAKILSNTLRNGRVGNCVLRQIRRLRFKKPDGGICVVRFPLAFSSN
ncbi:MAG: AgmX/PglI C-terminal domain-containing protein [Myxococcales bacterium]|nr:AgmX/PglI C-terminal domain-containing protein [Myxococcales bacterium]